MKQTVMEQFRESLPAFEEMIDKFSKGEVSVKDYKGFSGGYGSYAQKGGEKNMLRLRLSGGQLSKDQLQFIVESIEKWQVDKVHFTTCQTIQLHDLQPDAVCDIMRRAVDVGILTRGGGGDFPRNVMASPLSGVEIGEYFDVTPYAMAAADYLMEIIGTVKLPRKLKVAFSNSPANHTHATFRDLGFVANSDHTFDVYSAGGLGNNARMGALVAEHIPVEKILYYIQAMVNTFTTYGNYENRAKARTRYMQESLGTEGYVKAYQEKLQEVFAQYALDIDVKPVPVTKQGTGVAPDHPRICPQKQQGLYYVTYHPIGGSPVPSKLREIYDAIAGMEQVSLRVAPDETMYIINLTAEEAQKVAAVTDDGARTLFETSVACIGSSICQIGLRDSQGLLRTLVETARKENFADGVLPRIHISGCTSSCGTHQIGVLGFHGASKPVDKKPEPAFNFFVGGEDLQGEERFGQRLGAMLVEDIPVFLTELGRTVTASGLSFQDWFPANREALIEMANKYIEG